MMTTSERAAQKLRDNLVQWCLDAGLGFRVVNNNRETDPAVFNIKLDKECPGDEVIVSQGIRIFLDPVNAAALNDHELDYVDGPACGFCLKTSKEAVRFEKVKAYDYKNQVGS